MFSSLGATYSLFSTIDDSVVTNQFTGEEIPRSFDRSLSSLRLTYLWDKRNSRLNPTRGPRFQTVLDYAGGALGGDSDYLRTVVKGTLYKPVTQKALTTVVAVNVEAAQIDPFGGSNLFVFDRFYTGGETTVRGFRSRSLYPRQEDNSAFTDNFTGLFLGGDKRFFANLEYHFVPNESFRVLLFADGGNVFFDSQGWDFDNLRYSAGLEFRLTVPLFGAPLRFIWARNLDPIETVFSEDGASILVAGDRFDDFQFAISTTF